MGIMGFLKFASLCIDFLAWPLIALCYPLYASIRAVETGSNYHMRKMVIYWTLFSIISLFDFAFMKIIQWIPFWSSIRFIAVLLLVMPQFDGACDAYESLVRPVLSVDLQSVIDKFYKLKKDKPHKREAFLDLVDKYIKENGSEALEMFIASKHLCKEDCNNLQRDTQVPETEEKIAAATLKQKKEPVTAQHDNEMLEATKKSAAAKAKYVQSPQSVATSWVPKGTGAAAKVKDMTPPEASAQNRRPETPPLKKAQQEWTCDLCQATTINEKTLNAHLQGSKHKSKCESLKASKLHANDTGPSPLATGKSNQGNLKAVNNKVGQASQQKSSEKTQESDASQHENEMLEATKKSEVTEAKHVQSPQSVATAWVPKGTGAAAKVKDMTPPEASAQNRRPETPPLKKAQQEEWICDLCKVTTTSEKDLNAHLQGSKHMSKCESLKARKLHANDIGATPLASGKSNQGNLKAVNNKVWQASQQKSSEKTQETVIFEVPRVHQNQTKQDGGANQIFNHYCILCDVKLVSDIDLASHVKGKLHLSNMNNW